MSPVKLQVLIPVNHKTDNYIISLFKRTERKFQNFESMHSSKKIIKHKIVRMRNKQYYSTVYFSPKGSFFVFSIPNACLLDLPICHRPLMYLYVPELNFLSRYFLKHGIFSIQSSSFAVLTFSVAMVQPLFQHPKYLTIKRPTVMSHGARASSNHRNRFCLYHFILPS